MRCAGRMSVIVVFTRCLAVPMIIRRLRLRRRRCRLIAASQNQDRTGGRGRKGQTFNEFLHSKKVRVFGSGYTTPLAESHQPGSRKGSKANRSGQHESRSGNKEGARTGSAVRSKKDQDFWSNGGAVPGGVGPGASYLSRIEHSETACHDAVQTTVSGF